jgi:hypothetical protein
MERNLMNIYKEACFTKSFYMIGKSLSKCYNCSYCRLIGESDKLIRFDKIPSDINPMFTNIPVAINLFYGDPMLQIDDTIKYLKLLEQSYHKAPVVIITKGDFSKFPKLDLKLDLHFAFSTFGVDSEYDGGNLKTFENNLNIASTLKYKYSIEYRPVIKNINDSYETIENIYKIANKYNAPIGFCGLQVSDELKQYLLENDIQFEPYIGYEFGLKKYISNDVENIFYNLGEKYNVPTFKKTSCLISYLHSMERDYNAHYYRPNDMRCSKCVMKDKCLDFKKKQDNSNIEQVNIPFKHKIIFKDKHICTLHKKGLCKFAHNDCKNISGKLIKIDDKITTSDVRLIKWLTGYTVDCEFNELEYISNNWLKINT